MGPHIGNVTCPLLVWLICLGVTIQKLWGDVELVITVRCYLVFARSNYRDTVLAHQTAHATVPDIQTNLFQLFVHTGPAIPTKAEAGLFFDVRKCHHIRSLPAAGWSITESTQTSKTNPDDSAQ
jgi:hypothetical protein